MYERLLRYGNDPYITLDFGIVSTDYSVDTGSCFATSNISGTSSRMKKQLHSLSS